MKVKIVAPDIDLTRPQFQADHGPIGGVGDTNPLFPLILQCAAWGLPVKKGEGSEAYVDGISDERLLDISTVQQLVAMGLEVWGYPAFVQLEVANATDEVPNYLTSAYFVDDATGDPSGLKTWEQWGQTSIERGDSLFIELNGSGAPEKGSTINSLVLGGFTVLSLPQTRELISEEEDPS